MNYREQCERFDWKRWERYKALQAAGMSTPAIALECGSTACKVRRVLADGERLDWWRRTHAQG